VTCNQIVIFDYTGETPKHTKMKFFKSLFAAAFCSTLVLTSFSQTETTEDDSDCHSTRWILVKNNKQNADLFASLPEIFEEIKRQNDLEVLFATRETVEVGPLIDEKGKLIINETEDGGQAFVYQDKTVTLVQSDVPLVDNTGNPIIVTSDDGMASFVFPNPEIVGLNTDVPLVDENGKPIIQTTDEGKMNFVYPTTVEFTVQPRVYALSEKGELSSIEAGDATTYSISEQSISELRVIQSRRYNAETGEYSDEFHVSRIGFCMNPSATEQERLWIDLVTFFENVENPKEYAFYTLLSEGDFSGFQYRQTPCK